MGLDMYLTRKVEFGGYNQGKITAKVENNKGEVIYEVENNDKEFGMTSISVEKGMAYWRKANAIHLWFIKKGELDEDGKPIDNCQPILLYKNDLEELLDKCEQVKAKAKLKWGLIKDCQERLNEDTIVEIYDPIKDEFGTIVELKATGEKMTYDKLTNGTFCKAISSEDLLRKFGSENFYYEKIESRLVQVWTFTDVITNVSEIAKILPTRRGFFFGSTEYDKWYMGDVNSTIEIIKQIIKEHDELVASGVKEYNIDYIYQASW